MYFKNLSKQTKVEQIKRRITDTPTKKIEIGYNYLLQRGGIAIHLRREENIKNLERDINAIYPGSTCSIPQFLRKHRKIIIKNTNPNITTEDLTNIIEENNLEKVYIKRFYSSYNHQPIPIICLTCKDALCDKLQSEGLNILGT